ncbi:glutaminase family protein [Kutzneria chonburiensis]|uniref:Glutaminase domain-containing protein n=1 Tax=Kutzneria chonburiensis TaxID=1483604 RepID=A0ABV6MNU3_9PSEU|nr:glutaminase family protein [Kutzneria chonburiensis]
MPNDRDRPAPAVGRRDLFRFSGAAGVTLAASSLLAPTASADEDSNPAAPSGFRPLRPPATPLAVRSPYLSTWLAGDYLAGEWAGFWTGRTTAMTGIARIDGVAYVFIGAPGLPDGQPAFRGMTQTDVTVTPTQSRFTLNAGGIELTVTFLSPIEPGDLRRQSAPLSYVSLRARSIDGKAHNVSLYLDISAEWAHGDSNASVSWDSRATGGVRTLSFTPSNPGVLAENGDMASWGTITWSTTERTGLSWQIGQDIVVRQAAVAGKLTGAADPAQPRRISDRWPVLGLDLDLGAVRGATEPFVISVGHLRTPAVSYLGTALPPLWTTYWPTWQQMISDFHHDAKAAAQRCGRLDDKVTSDARRAGGDKYAALCALALRQAYAGTELVVRDGKPWAFLKEISSDGNVSTIDVLYPAMPVFAYLDPQYLSLLLEPVLDYAETGGWPKTFAEHDLGSSYPNATGHNDGNEEDMPVEESANMLIMVAAAKKTGHYAILKQWADYLVDNALDPGYQNQTDDFTGFIAHSANLALKGIVAIGAMSQIAAAAGNTADAAHYLGIARDYIAQWQTKATDTTGQLKLAYDRPGTWSLKYNGFADALLGLNLIPAAVTAEEGNWYLKHRNQFGTPLDLRHSYTKADWALWTAAWQHDHPPVRDAFVDDVFDFVTSSGSRVPFTDLYDTISARQAGFQARPVVGGIFSLLALQRKP